MYSSTLRSNNSVYIKVRDDVINFVLFGSGKGGRGGGGLPRDVYS